jgi:hypothetical protein
MKQLRILFVLFYPLLSFSQKDEVEWKKHSNSKFSISYPENWDLQESSNSNSEFLILSSQKESENDIFVENVSLLIQQTDKDLNLQLNEFVSSIISQLDGFLIDFELIENTSYTKNGLTFKRLIYTGVKNDIDTYFTQLFCILNGKTFMLTFVSETDNLELYEKTAEQIMNSFEVK